MLTFISLLLVLAAVAGGFVLVLRALPSLREGLLATVDARLGSVDERIDRRFVGLEEKVDRRLEGIDGRILASQQNAGKTASEIVDRLGKLDGTAAQMLSRANDLARLEQALRPPKARGGVGEILLGNLLRDSLPPDAYQLQFTFRSGDRVDAIVKVDKLVPIDAKFPLDNFERLAGAADDTERELHERMFARDVKGHVDAIASKYIRPAEGTYDFALMYLPAESVYYELVCGKARTAYDHALAKRVFPVSPTTLHAYLLVITLGLKGLQIEKHAQEVMAYCGQLGKDFERFRGDFEVVGKHISNAQSKYSEADRRLGRLETQLERAADWDEAVEGQAVQELPRAVDAA
jgi:DNA recombination protein RmuC